MALVITRRRGESFDCIWPNGIKRRLTLQPTGSGAPGLSFGSDLAISLPLTVRPTPECAPVSIDCDKAQLHGQVRLSITCSREVAIQRDDAVRKGPRP